ncbi:hypothetical protein TorRG33x02_002870 [Trema orientale]|uniref:Uncharacterized protein n=1 Tax=Trema orientale TaxID=63057 RepID=A0A2P5G1P7_TREOI|nr:hypothetical protein TorRG33x02_002870 [Trema orientale]
MEGREAQTKNEALKSHLAIRCGKAAILLSSLKSSRCRRLNLNQIMNEEDEKEMLKKEIGDLKMKLVEERLRNKRIKLCGFMELLLQLLVLLSLIFTFLLLFVFTSL